MLHEIALTIHKDKEDDQYRGKRTKTMSEVKPVKNIRKNPKSFLETSSMQKEILPSHKLQDHAYK